MPQWPDVARMNDLEKSINALYDQIGAASGLSDSSFDILYALALYGDGCSQRELCERCWIGKQTIHSAIGRLVQRGVLSVEPGRGRATRVVLTEAGQALVREKVHPVLQAEARALARFSPEERAAIEDTLARYRDALIEELAATGGAACR